MTRNSKPQWRRLGHELRVLRKKAGMTQAQVATATNMVDSHVSAWERGTRGMTKEQAAQLDQIFDTNGLVSRAWKNMHAMEALPAWYEEVPQLEQAVSELREYQSQVVPGLIQTPEYSKALIQDSAPWASATDVDRMVESRMQRQEILNKEHPPLLSMVVEAPAIGRAIGGGPVLKGQLEQILSLIKKGVVRFQVMPPDAQCHPGASGPFRIYTFPDKPMVASAEHMGGERLMDEMIMVQHCITIFGILQSESLSPRASVDLIRKVKDEIDEQA